MDENSVRWMIKIDDIEKYDENAIGIIKNKKYLSEILAVRLYHSIADL